MPMDIFSRFTEIPFFFPKNFHFWNNFGLPLPRFGFSKFSHLSHPIVIHEVDATSVNINVQELIDLSFHGDPQHERLCNNCNIPITRYQSFCSTSDIFVNNESDRRTKKLTKVKQIPTRPIKLGQDTNKFRSMISHCGEFSAHYIALDKKNRH